MVSCVFVFKLHGLFMSADGDDKFFLLDFFPRVIVIYLMHIYIYSLAVSFSHELY